MNARIRRRGRPLPREEEREPEPPPLPATKPEGVDLGAGARASTPPVDPSKVFNEWVRQQARKSKLAPQTVEANMSDMGGRGAKP